MPNLDQYSHGPAGSHAGNPPPLAVLDQSNKMVAEALQKNGELLLQLMETIKELLYEMKRQREELQEQRKELKEQRKMHGKLDKLNELGAKVVKEHPEAIAQALRRVLNEIGLGTPPAAKRRASSSRTPR